MEDHVLTALRRVQGVTAAYVVDGDGVRGATATGDQAETQGALLAAVAGALGQASDDMGLGDVGEFLVEAANGALMAGALPNGRTAVVVTDSRANLGLVRVELRRLRRGL
jgi:predicted regulator of Ras-like GTPase activity (Roadblock/LC7/MglB family)